MNIDTNSKPATSRIVGPVTAATTGGVALATIICWLITALWGVEVPVPVQGSLSVILGIAGGYIVPTTRATGEHSL